MINIITTSLNGRNRGPRKVVVNLIKGLEKIGYPYVINRQLDATHRLWIHDDVSALLKLKDLPKEVKVIVGPNLFVNPKNIPSKIELSQSLYIHPSQNVVDIWKKKGYNRSKLVVYPTGIDTQAFIPSQLKKTEVILYFKNRTEKELAETEVVLKQSNISYTLLRYGSYKEEEYKKALDTARYMIWLGGYESQGIALEEALACNVPILVLERQPENEFEYCSSSTPYWSSECGIRVTKEHLLESIDEMENRLPIFTPRLFIERELGLEKQAYAFVQMYEDHFNLSVEEGHHALLLHKGHWKGGCFRRFIKWLLMW